MRRRKRNIALATCALLLALLPAALQAQINTRRMMTIGKNAVYFEDYVLSIQYFNLVINAKPYQWEPYFYRALAKYNLEDFAGSDQDCSRAIELNPYVVKSYSLRGMVRIRQQRYRQAADDYRKALSYNPVDEGLWHNLALCLIRQEKYDEAEQALDSLLAVSPRYATAHLIRARVEMQRGDTLKAADDVQRAIELDRYNPDAYSARAMMHSLFDRYAQAEADIDYAIHLDYHNPAHYISRAMVRFYANNLRGALQDYDQAIDLDSLNLVGRYNRGLLRAQVGDDNRAIEDFDVVLAIEPGNTMARFNRAMLRDQTGDLHGAIADYSEVIDEYPNFYYGYELRAAARRRIGDKRGADADEYTLMMAQIDRMNAAANPGAKTDGDGSQEEADNRRDKTRRRSDKNMRNYGKLVVTDADDTGGYANEYRGRVQNRNVQVQMEPLFVLTYYQRESDVKHTIHYYKPLENANKQLAGGQPLIITNAEAALDEGQIARHFDNISRLSGQIADEPDDAALLFLRSLNCYLVQDLNAALDDLDRAIAEGGDQVWMAYFNRASIRSKAAESRQAGSDWDDAADAPQTPAFPAKEPKSALQNLRSMDVALELQAAKSDLNKVIDIAPDFVYAYYNRANLFARLGDYKSAIADYDRALQMNPHFAEAYYNRGLVHLYLNETEAGNADLGRAGELGLYHAYNVMKRFAPAE